MSSSYAVSSAMIRLALSIDRADDTVFAGLRRDFSGGRFTTVVHSDAAIARRQAEALGATEVAASLDELFETQSETLDVLITFGLEGATSSLFDLAARAGKHVLILDAFAESAIAAKRAMDAFTSPTALWSVANMERFMPAVEAAREQLAGGSLGKAALINLHRWKGAEVGQSKVTTTSKSESSGGLVFGALGDIDLANWFFDELPESVFAIGAGQEARGSASVESGAPHCLQLHLGYSDGRVGLIDYAQGLPAGSGYHAFSLIGSSGAVYSDDQHDAQILFQNKGVGVSIADYRSSARVSCVREFVRAVGDGPCPERFGSDLPGAIRVAEAALGSLRSGESVQLAGS